jgi:hypothetical protein
MKTVLALLLFLLPTMVAAKTAKELNDACRARSAPILKGAACTPTFEQCEADIAAWQHRGTVGKSELSFENLASRDKEVLSCEIYYPGAPEQLEWLKVDRDIHVLMEGRYIDFLESHKLFNQFLTEDEQKTADSKTSSQHLPKE